jgi:putative phosphoesterase
MMKILVLSDSHNKDSKRMNHAVEKVSPDAIVHLGDMVNDAKSLKMHYSDIAFYFVKGNCDFSDPEPTKLFLTLEGVKIYMTHGHLFDVKSGLEQLTDHGLALGAGIVLFGHTHKATIKQERGMWLMNPGQMEWHILGMPASYGILTLHNGSITCGIEYLPLQV